LLYYIISGSGANAVGGKTEARGPGSLIYEPIGRVYEWGNPGIEPLTLLAFNVNPDGSGSRPSGRAGEDSIAAYTRDSQAGCRPSIRSVAVWRRLTSNCARGERTTLN
jgi:hypothetical protein